VVVVENMDLWNNLPETFESVIVFLDKKQLLR